MGEGDFLTLQYNTYIELTSLLFLCFAAVRFSRKRRFPDRKSFSFGFFLVIAILAVIFNLAGCYLMHIVSRGWNMFINEMVFMLQFLLSSAILYYSILICGMSTKKYKGISIAIWVFTAIVLLLILSNVFNGWLFFFDKDMNYYHGFYYELYFVPFAICLLFAAVIPMIHSRKGNPARYLSISVYCIVAAICMAIQYYFPDMLLTGLAIAIGTLVIYLNIQNPVSAKDPLTGAYSRETFTKFADELIQEGRSYPLIYGDIVGTKTFNKTFGESYGNIMIAKVSDLLAGISSKNIVFRYTGDSFIIIVIDSAHLEEYKEKVIEALKRSINIESMNIVVQIKMFCINDMKMETSSESLSRTIELSSRMLKNSHPNKIVTLSKEVIRESQRSSEIEGALRRALASNNIEIFLQPVIDITTGRVAAAEALARINDPEMGLIRPADFIPIAEETGMISSLSLKVVNRVCMFLKSTPLECYRNLKWVSINLSVSDCLSRAQGEKICNIIESYGIAPHKIAFEITETMATIEKILPENLRILTDKGFSLALDDFGTEYANIDSALRLPFSLAKLDRSVIHIVHNGNQMKILKRMVGVFNELGLETVAEGVDSQEMIDIAASAGVRYMQGFFYSKPLPVNVFINYLIQNKERNNQ